MRRVRLAVSPGEPGPRALELTEAQLRDAVVKHLHPGAINPVIVLLIRGAEEVKVTSHHNREGGSGDLLLQLGEEGRGAAVIRRSVDDDDLPFEVECTLGDLHTDEELTPIHSSHLKGGILNT